MLLYKGRDGRAVWRAWYGTARWKRARAERLSAHPLCMKCQQQGLTTAASVVDNIKPHRGDAALFWDPLNFQSLCKPHHDATKQREEELGQIIGTEVTGRPRDPKHPWNQSA
jgi:5-methylcytosine-specific restriction protein A